MKTTNKARKYKSPLIDELLEETTPIEMEQSKSKMQIAAKIEDLMIERGWNKTQFAGMVGKNPSEITKWLSGTQNFTIDILIEIASAFKVNITELFTNKKEQVIYRGKIAVKSSGKAAEIRRFCFNFSRRSNCIFILLQHSEMNTIEQKEVNIKMQIKAIELLNNSIILPPNAKNPITNFNFNLNIESKADTSKKLVFVIVNVEIKNDDQSLIIGTISVSCVYEIFNFEEVIKIEVDGRINMPPKLVETLNIISISTTRGVMFSTFKGTFLHNAFLPIIDPKMLIN
jgi:transcriptional regulator with XRE-family HTH domain